MVKDSLPRGGGGNKKKRSKGWVGASHRKGKGLPCGLGDYQKASLTGGGMGSECMGNRMKASGTV